MKILMIICFALSTIGSGFAEEANQPDREELNIAVAMQGAILVDEDIEKARAILKSGFDISSSVGCQGYSALHAAVQIRNKEMIRLFLDAGAKPDDQVMLWAFRTNDEDLDIPTMLIAAGGNPKAFEHPYTTCLYSAVWYGNTALVKLLIGQEEAELDRPGELGTPLSLAIRKGNFQIARLLISSGADLHRRGHDGKASSAAELIDERLAQLSDVKAYIIKATDEQDGAHRSATAGDAKYESNRKPKPESKGRSQ